MIKLSSDEKLKKDKYVYHSTDKKYNYPFIDPEISISGGYGGDAYGRGFYTTDDKKVLEGYKKRIENPIIRKQKLPIGTVLFDYDNITPEWSEKIVDFLNKNDPSIFVDKTKFYNVGDILRHYYRNDQYGEQKASNLINIFLRDQGIDVIKHHAGKNTKKNYSGKNYVIINNQLINKNKNSEYINDRLQSIKNSFPYASSQDIIFLKKYNPETLENLFNISVDKNESGDAIPIAIIANNEFYFEKCRPFINQYGTLIRYTIDYNNANIIKYFIDDINIQHFMHSLVTMLNNKKGTRSMRYILNKFIDFFPDPINQNLKTISRETDFSLIQDLKSRSDYDIYMYLKNHPEDFDFFKSKLNSAELERFQSMFEMLNMELY